MWNISKGQGRNVLWPFLFGKDGLMMEMGIKMGTLIGDIARVKAVAYALPMPATNPDWERMDR
jgi:hypothetical protein